MGYVINAVIFFIASHLIHIMFFLSLLYFIIEYRQRKTKEMSIFSILALISTGILFLLYVVNGY